MAKKHHNLSKKKSTPKTQPDVDASGLSPLEAATNDTLEKKHDLYIQNGDFFTSSRGLDFPDYRNGNLATPIPSRSSSLASEVSLNSLADLLGPELDDEDDSVQDQDEDSHEGYKSTDMTPSVIEGEEKPDDLWTWITSGQEKTQRVPGLLQGRDWAAIGVLTLTAIAVRLWEIDTPNQVVLDEALVGKYVNGYLTKQFTFDTHPPLGKLLLAGISKIVSNYSGTFPFDDISDTYPSELPYKTMRSVVASIGALCAPMAYVTLRALGQAPSASIVAAFMIIFDNALMASHRLMTLEAPLLFFTALSLMSWAKWTEQESRPFTAQWWAWLVMTGVAVAGALATKTEGLLTMLTIVVLAGWDLIEQESMPFTAQWWAWLMVTGVAVAGALAIMADGLLNSLVFVVLAGIELTRQTRDRADQRPQRPTLLSKHLASRVLALLILPFTLYLAVFSIHLSLQSHQPPYRASAQGDYDLNMLSHPFRHSLLSPYDKDRNPTQAWSDVVYGSVIQLQSETRPAVFLHSFKQMWNPTPLASSNDTRPDQDQRQYQQVAGYEYSDLNTLWIVVRANITSTSVTTPLSKGTTNTEHLTVANKKPRENLQGEESEIPKRLQYLRDGDLIRLRHLSTRRCLHSRNVPSTDARRGPSQSFSDQDECDQSCELSAVGEAESASNMQNSNDNHENDDGPQDWWTVQVIDNTPLSWLSSGAQDRAGSQIKALETTFRLRHHVLGCYLHTTERELSEEVPGGAGRRELSCVRDDSLKLSTVWRITMNEHDYLPMDTALAVYPKMSTLEKIMELHTLMWTRPRAFEVSGSLDVSGSRSNLWSLMMGTTSARTLWRRTHGDPDSAEELDEATDREDGSEAQDKASTIQQNSIVANPAVWWTSNLGLAVFAGLQILFVLGNLLGFMKNGSPLAIMKEQLSALGPIFAAWAIHILPFLFPILPETRSFSRSTLDLYYPALYCAILVSSTVFSSLLSALASRRHQFSFLLVLTLIILSVSNLISPFSYGTRMTLGQCESLAHWINKGATLLQFPLLSQQDTISNPSIMLDCGASSSSGASASFSSPLPITQVIGRTTPPVLQKHYPAVEEALPMQHVFMTPSQRPPQLWHVNRQTGEPNPYQRQQMQAIFELIEKEEKQRRVKEKLELEEKERLERLERQRLELEEKRREMERELKREEVAKERERLRLEEKRRREVELEVEEELRQEQVLKEGIW